MLPQHDVPQYFLPFPKQISIFSQIYFVVCKCFQFGPVENFVIWERVNPLPHNTAFWHTIDI